MHRTWGDKRCGGKRSRGKDERNKKPWQSIRFIPPRPLGIKGLIGLRAGMKGQDGEEEKEGGLYKNVKRALQPFSRRSAGGH